MTIPRFFIPPLELQQDNIALRGKDHHHLGRVLRARLGDEVWLLNGSGDVARAAIEAMRRDFTLLRVVERKHVNEETPRMHLYQALLRGAKMDLVVEASVELGVSTVVPFVCRRSHAVTAVEERRLERWRAIAVQSARLAGRPYLPEILPPLAWEELTTKIRGSGTSLFADERGGVRVEDALKEAKATRAVDIALVVGPEGGFEDVEREALRGEGAAPVTLGPYILSAEYAGMALIVAARCACGLM